MLQKHHFTKWHFFGLAYFILLVICLVDLSRAGDLSLGRNPLENLLKTASEMLRPSFLDVWFGNEALEYRSDDGTLLRVENRRELEISYLFGLLRALWITIQIATLGSFLGAIIALPLGILVAKNLAAPKIFSLSAKLILDVSRSVHTLVFGLIFVGIIGLGPTAGILAIAAHSMGTFGKLYAEAIETIEMDCVRAISSSGARPMQVFFIGVWPSVLPQVVSTNLYLWEYNIRDSTVLGFVGAGGLGLLFSEAISLFQWGRLTTVILVVVMLVVLFDALSRKIRQILL